MQHPQLHEDFLKFESKVTQVLRLLDDMGSLTKSDAEAKPDTKQVKAEEELNEDDCIVVVRSDRTVLNDAPVQDVTDQVEMDKFTFMEQIEKDANERARVRQEREQLAQHFRSLGNDAFRKNSFESAILMYNKAIEHIKDSPILYTNRGLCYIKTKNYKRAIVDCDFVLNKLDEKNLRAWLYRAAAYKRLGDTHNFDTSIKFAKKNNIKEVEYIDNFMHKIRSDTF